MIIYQAEKEAGISELILSLNKILYCSELQVEKTFETSKNNILDKKILLSTNIGQEDLHYLRTILVSTLWNKNDEYFRPKEVYLARKTPEDKPFNFQHDPNDVIGHITDNYVIDDEGTLYAADTSLDDLPEKFHILTSAVIYKWIATELEERMAKIIAEIGEGKWFVSTEALFDDFDYAIEENKETKIVERTKATAHLSKFLRAYGGDGKYENKRIGRAPKNIIFSGKGLVERPANPESIILANSTQIKKNLVYYSKNETIKTEKKMTETELLQKQLADLQATVKNLTEDKTKLEATLKDIDSKALNQKIADLDAQVKAKDASLAQANEKFAKLDEVKTTLEKQLAESVGNLKSANDQLASLKAAEIKKVRLSTLAKKLAVAETDEDTVKLADSLAGLTDEAFATFVDTLGKKYVAANKTAEQQALEQVEAAKKTAKPEVTLASETENENKEQVAKTKVREQILACFDGE